MKNSKNEQILLKIIKKCKNDQKIIYVKNSEIFLEFQGYSLFQKKKQRKKIEKKNLNIFFQNFNEHFN